MRTARQMGRWAAFSALSVLCIFNHHGAGVTAQQRMGSNSSNGGGEDVDGNLSAGKLRSLCEEASMERRYDDAVEFIKKAILLEPENALNHFKLFNVHKRMKRLTDALEDLTKSLEIDHKNVNYRTERFVIYISELVTFPCGHDTVSHNSIHLFYRVSCNVGQNFLLP